MTAPGIFATHRHPVWRERADFIINAALPEPERFEQLWCRRVGDDQFEVCCVPFFVYDLALGDVVRTASSEGLSFLFSRVVAPSGRFVFRVWFGSALLHRDEIAAELVSRGALIEWSSKSLLAVDARDAAHATQIADFLQEQESAGHLAYETGRS